MIRTKEQWKKARDAAGGKGSLVKGVSMTDLLDAYHKAGAGKSGLNAMLARSRTLTPLLNGLKKYKAAIPPGKPKLTEIIDEMIEDVQKEIKLGAEMANPVVNMSKYIKSTIANAKKVMASGDATAYGNLWNQDVRGFGTSLGKLVKIDAGVKDIHANWLPYTTGDWDTAGKFVAEGVRDEQQKKARIQAAAKEIYGLAIKVESEMKSRKMIQ
jgi:hypothetical protein